MRYFSFVFLLCASSVSSHKLTVYVQEAAPVTYTDDTVLSHFLQVLINSPNSDSYKFSVLKEGLNGQAAREHPDYQPLRDYLSAEGDKLGLLVTPRTFYNRALMDSELTEEKLMVPGFTVDLLKTAAHDQPNVLVMADQEHFRKYDLGELKEVGKFEILPAGLKPIKE